MITIINSVINKKLIISIMFLILILPLGLINTSHADTSTSSVDNRPALNPKTVGLITGKGTDFTYSFFDPIFQNTINVLVINGTSFHIDILNTLDMHNNQITNGVVLQEASSQTSDLNAILNIPIPNHQCTTYFNIGDNTFRYVCNANGIAHELSKG